MNTQQDNNSQKTFTYEHELERHLVDHFDDILAATGLEFLLVGHQPRVPGNRADLLTLDKNGTPVLIELKIGAAVPDAVTQLLRYAHAISALTEDDFLALPNNTGETMNLAERFEARFGRSFAINRASAPGMVLIAKSYKPETAQVLAALQSHGTAVHAYLYITDDTGAGFRIEPVGHDELTRIALEDPGLHADELDEGEAPDGPPEKAQKLVKHNVHIHDEVREFWEEFAATYKYPVAPIALIVQKFEDWQTRNSTGVLPLLPKNQGNIGLLAREIKHLAEDVDGWVRFFYRHDCPVFAAANPRTPLEARLRRGYPYTRAAYARQDTLAQHVELVA